jgi:iron complex transport system substrate-binding protein
VSRFVSLYNGLGFAFALSLAVLSGLRSGSGPSVAASSERVGASDDFPRRDTRGTPELRDKSGVWLPLIDYRRIASGSTIADELLLEFAEPDRIVAFTKFSQENPSKAHRFSGKPLLSGLDDLETLIALEPDLLLLNTLGSQTRVARLRELGIRVFDLGEMRGVESFLANARAVATIAGRTSLGERYAERFRARLHRVAPDVPKGERKRAAYLSVFGTSIYGGGRRTSYDDVLRHAGLENALAKTYEGWPDLGPEEVLASNPELVVTHRGMGPLLCSLPKLDRLEACKGERPAIVELEPSVLSDPGSGILTAAEQVHDRVADLTEERR